jgi:hypothetical protein
MIGVEIPVEARDFSLLHNVQAHSEAHLLFSEYWSILYRLKRLRLDANHSL